MLSDLFAAGRSAAGVEADGGWQPRTAKAATHNHTEQEFIGFISQITGGRRGAFSSENERARKHYSYCELALHSTTERKLPSIVKETLPACGARKPRMVAVCACPFGSGQYGYGAHETGVRFSATLVR